MTSIFGVPVDVAYHLVSGLTSVLTPVLGGLAAVAGIVLITLAVRLIVMPLSFRAMRGQAIQARLAPQVQALRKRHSQRPEVLQRELTALYKREGTSMFAGLAPLLLQGPFLSVMYLLFRSPVVGGQPNKLLAHDLLGVPLGMHWLDGTGVISLQGAVFLAVFALLAVLCWLSARLARSMMAVPAGTASAGTVAGGAVLGNVLPFLTVAFAAFAPLAAGVYLVTSTGWSLLERRLFRRTGARLPARAKGPDRPQHRCTSCAHRRSLPGGPAKAVCRWCRRPRIRHLTYLAHVNRGVPCPSVAWIPASRQASNGSSPIPFLTAK
jgi:YidC/Oxa1 family membrane protein insertase